MATRRSKAKRRAFRPGLVAFVVLAVLAVAGVRTLLIWLSHLSNGAVLSVALVLLGASGLAITVRLALNRRAAEKTKRRELDVLARRATLGELLAIEPYEFEHTVANLLRQLGYQDVVVTKQSGDEGIDVRAKTVAGLLVGVQCKQYSRGHLCRGPEVSQFIGSYKSIHALGRGIFVTTSTFTPQALRFAEKDATLELWNGEDLVRLIRTATANPESSVKPLTQRLAPRQWSAHGWASLGFTALTLLGVATWAARSRQPVRSAPVQPAFANLSFATTPTMSAAPEPLVTYEVVNTGKLGLIVRDGPGGAKKGTIHDGDLIVVVEGSNGWDHVRGEGFDGYVSAQYLAGPTSGLQNKLAKIGP